MIVGILKFFTNNDLKYTLSTYLEIHLIHVPKLCCTRMNNFNF